MRLLGIRPVTAPDEFTEIVEVVVEESEIEEGYVKIIVTRGSDDHNFTIPARSALQPNVLVYGKPIDLNAIEKVQSGVNCITLDDDRGHHCDILSLNQLNNMMARAEAQKKIVMMLSLLRWAFDRSISFKCMYCQSGSYLDAGNE